MSLVRTIAGIALGVVLIILAGCTSSPDGAEHSATPSVTQSSASSSTIVTPVPTPSATVSASSAPDASSTSASPTPSTPDPANFTTTCSMLTVRVLKGGAVRGAEIAAMQFQNDGSTPCTITGTPTATLLRNGSKVGTRSQPDRSSARLFTLQAGDVGESLLRDFSTCNAPLADHIQLSMPTRNGKAGATVTEPITLRACELRVAPVGTPA